MGANFYLKGKILLIKNSFFSNNLFIEKDGIKDGIKIFLTKVIRFQGYRLYMIEFGKK